MLEKNIELTMVAIILTVIGPCTECNIVFVLLL